MIKTNLSNIKAIAGTFSAAPVVAVRLFFSNPKRKSASVFNNDATTVYVVSSERSLAADGKPILAATERVWKHFDCQGEFWVKGTAAATYDLRVEEVTQQ